MTDEKKVEAAPAATGAIALDDNLIDRIREMIKNRKQSADMDDAAKEKAEAEARAKEEAEAEAAAKAEEEARKKAAAETLAKLEAEEKVIRDAILAARDERLKALAEEKAEPAAETAKMTPEELRNMPLDDLMGQLDWINQRAGRR